MIKNEVLFLFLSLFSFLSLAGVTSIYHRGSDIYIKYDAEYEFSANKFLSSLEQEEQKVSRLNPNLTSFVKNQCVILPVCSKEDQVCLRYVAKVDRIRKSIKNGFQRERILYEQKQAVRRESIIYEQNVAHIRANIEQNTLQLKMINRIQEFLLVLMDNQGYVFQILTQFREEHPNIEYNQSNTKEHIARMTNWIKENYPDDIVLIPFLKELDKRYDLRNQKVIEITSNVYILLLNSNSEEVLDTFWQFTNEMEATVLKQIDSLTDRENMERTKSTSNNQRRKQIEREREELWAKIKAQGARRVYPRRSFSEFSGCRNCLIP